MVRRWWKRVWERQETAAEEASLPNLSAWWLAAARSAGPCCGCGEGGCALPLRTAAEEEPEAPSRR